jgi:hypothetical protein
MLLVYCYIFEARAYLCGPPIKFALSIRTPVTTKKLLDGFSLYLVWALFPLEAPS